MKPTVGVALLYFWPGFLPEHFKAFFPFVYDTYDVVPSSHEPDVIFYSVYAPQFPSHGGDPRRFGPLPGLVPGNYVRVFITGENLEPDMEGCEFAISFSAFANHPNHLRLPLWIYEGRGWGYGPERLVKSADTDWEKVAAEKTEFCNFLYMHEVPYRDAVLKRLNDYKPVHSAGRHLNTMSGWTVPMRPSRVAAKVEFFRRYKFTLAVENSIWPGYTTEKLVDPMFANSIPIYVGDPQAQLSFDPKGYIDFHCFPDIKSMLDFVRETDNNRALYLKLLAAPFYRNNTMPDYARDERTLAFFDRIFAAGLERRSQRGRRTHSPF